MQNEHSRNQQESKQRNNCCGMRPTLAGEHERKALERELEHAKDLTKVVLMYCFN